jgi:hypothetical protein
VTPDQLSALAEIQGKKSPKHNYQAGWREIGGKRNYYRSKWESNYALYLDWQKSQGLIDDWEHEPKKFVFEKIKQGTTTYLPDFSVTIAGQTEYHEVKGYMDSKSRTKLNRMRINYPKIKMVLIDQEAYRAIEKSMKAILAGWL